MNKGRPSQPGKAQLMPCRPLCPFPTEHGKCLAERRRRCTEILGCPSNKKWNSNFVLTLQPSISYSSYPTWTPPSQVPLPQMPTSATAPYPPSSISESYSKVPLSGAPGFTAEPQEMSQLQNSMAPPVPLSADPQPPAMRTQYYSQSTSGPPSQMSLASAPSCSSDNNLSVPRYVDNNPRPNKSPRTAGHQSVHSSGSLSNEQSEYRYGPPYGHSSSESTSAYSSSATSGPASSESTRATTQSSNQTPTTSISGSLPPRDYLPPSSSWTTTAGEPTSTVSYTNGDSRSYSYQDYKPAPLKADTQPPTGPPSTPAQA